MHSSCQGCLDRGALFTYEELCTYDGPEPESFMGWGTFLVTVASNKSFTLLVQMIQSDKFKDHWKIVENLSETEFLLTCLNSDQTKGPFLINPGPTPCVMSWAEVLSPPVQQKWYHFQDPKVREAVLQSSDQLYDGLKEVDSSSQIYYVMTCYPQLQTFYIMKNQEVKKMEEEYEKIYPQKRKREDEKGSLTLDFGFQLVTEKKEIVTMYLTNEAKSKCAHCKEVKSNSFAHETVILCSECVQEALFKGWTPLPQEKNHYLLFTWNQFLEVMK
jgi:hypothetical protein